MKCENCKNHEYCEFYSTFCFEIEDEERRSKMKELARIIFKYDNKHNKYYVNDKEIERDDWIKAKSTWECEQSYNHIKRYVDEWGFTDHDYYTKGNVDVWVFTTVEK